MLFLAYFPYYFLVCLVDFRHINGVQIHLRCLYGVMPHALADYWNGYVHISRYACPCMPCGICGEWHFQPCHFTYLLQIIVDVLQHTMILFLFDSVILLNNRKKIGTGGIYLCVSVDYFLRLFYPFHSQILVGLLLNILIQQRSPVCYQQSMWIIVRSRHSLQLSCCHQFSCQDIAASLNAMSSVIGELHMQYVPLRTSPPLPSPTHIP